MWLWRYRADGHSRGPQLVPSLVGEVATCAIFDEEKMMWEHQGGKLILTRKGRKTDLGAQDEFWRVADNCRKRRDLKLEVMAWIIPCSRQDGPVGRGLSSRVEHASPQHSTF